QADVEVHAMIVAAAQAVFGMLPPHAQAGGNAELAPALGAAEAGLPGTAQLWLPARSGQQRQQRHESGQRIIAGKIAPGTPGLAAGVAHVGTPAGHRQCHRSTERIDAAQAVACVALELAGIATQALVVYVPRRATAVGQLVLL